jgi:hypothetical protein
MNGIVPFHGGAAIITAAAGRPDIRAMVKHFMQPYGAAQPFANIVEIVRRNSTPSRRGKNEGRSAAIEIRKAVAGHLDAVVKARDHLSVVRLAPDESDVRGIIGAMMMVFHAPATETSSFFVDVLVLELREPEVGDPFSLPAVAAAARECWSTLPAPPSIAEFLVAARKHQQRLDDVFRQLGDIIEASQWADDLIEPDKPVDEDDPDFIPF